MICTPSAFPLAVLAEATRISPHRRTSSDGICGDAAHQATHSDHNPDARGIPHAVDISQSTPGAPFWLPSYGLFDAHAYGWVIAERMKAGTETRVKYLVSFLNGHDVIFDPAVSMTWRLNATGTEHASHLHVSFDYTLAAENSTAPFFLPATPTPPPVVVIPPPVTTDLGDRPVKLTDISMKLDSAGNGHVPVAGVRSGAVVAVTGIATPSPEKIGRYVPIPSVNLTIGADGYAEIVVEHGPPSGPATVRVAHV